MVAKIATAGRGSAERPFNRLFSFIDVEKQLSGSARDCYVALRARILLMVSFFPEREAIPSMAYKKSKSPTYDDDHNKLTEGTRDKLAVPPVDGLPEGD